MMEMKDVGNDEMYKSLTAGRVGWRFTNQKSLPPVYSAPQWLLPLSLFCICAYLPTSIVSSVLRSSLQALHAMENRKKNLALGTASHTSNFMNKSSLITEHAAIVLCE